MNIELKFDHHSRMIYIPDGYIYDLSELKNNFFDWIQYQQECILEAPDHKQGLSYDEEDFLRYVNNILLEECSEKAYFVSKRKKNHTITF